MKIKKIIRFYVATFVALSILGVGFSSPVAAQTCLTGGAQGGTVEVDCDAVFPGVSLDPSKCYSAGPYGAAEVDCVLKEDVEDNPIGSSGSVGGTGSTELDGWLNTAINVLAALVGIAIVASILIGAIQYITAGSNTSQVGAAKQRITMAVLGFGLFLMGYALLQWLIPGGIW